MDITYQSEETDETDSQSLSVATNHSFRGTNFIDSSMVPIMFGPSAARTGVGGRATRRPHRPPTAPSSSAHTPTLNAEWTSSRWTEWEQPFRPTIGRREEEEERQRQVRSAAHDAERRRFQMQAYGSVRPLAINGHRPYMGNNYAPAMNQYDSLNFARPRSTYEQNLRAQPPSSYQRYVPPWESNTQVQPPNEHQAYIPEYSSVSARGTAAGPSLTEQMTREETTVLPREINRVDPPMPFMAMDQTSSSLDTTEDPRTEGAGPASGADTPQHGYPRPAIPHVPGQVPYIPPHISLERRVRENQVPVQSSSGMNTRVLPVSRAPRGRVPGGPQRVAVYTDVQHAHDGVPDLDQQSNKLPSSIKTREQMMVNLECKVCFEQTCSVVLLPCRK